MATNIFEMFGKIGADDKPAMQAIDRVVGHAKTANNTLSNGLSSMGSFFTGVGDKLTSSITKPALGATTALTGITLVKGFQRLMGIDEAKAKLLGLGHSGESVETIMNSALESVKGTSFGMADAATIAASAVAAGIEPGKELTKYLKLTGDAAAIAGISLSDMGSIINKVQTSNVAYTDNLNQLADRGLPIYQWIAEEAGVATDAVKDMASGGEISSEMFLAAIEKNIGGAAKIIGENSFKASIDNMWASVGRIGANFLDAGGKGGGFFSTLKPLIGEFTGTLEKLEGKASDLGVKFGQTFKGTIDFIMDLKAKFDSLSPAMQETTLKAAGLGTAFAVGIGPALQIAGKFTSALSPVAKAFETVDFVIQNASSGIGSNISKLVSSGGLFEQFGGKVSGATKSVFDTVSKSDYGQLFHSYSNMAKNGLNDVGLSLMDKVPFIENFGNKILGMSQNSDSGFNKVKNGLSGVMDKVSPVLSSASSAATGVVSKTTGALGTVMSMAMSALGPAAIGGLLLAGLGLVNNMFGDQINQMIVLAKEKGPEIIKSLGDSIAIGAPEFIAKGTELLRGLLEALLANLPQFIDSGVQIITALIAGVTSSIPTLLPVVIEIVGALVNGIIASAPQLLLAGLDLLQGLIDGIVSNIPLIATTAMGIVTNFGTTLENNLPKILEKGINILVSLINGIVQAIPKLIPIALQLIKTIANAIMSNLPTIIDGGIKVLDALIKGVVSLIPQLIPMIVQVITAILQAITSNLPQILAKGVELLGKLGAGIIQAIPTIVGMIPQVISGIVEVFTSFDWLGIGKDIIMGIASGITNFAGTIVDAAKGAASKAFEGAKNFLGIHSPSRLFRDGVGIFIPQGIAAGIDKDADTIQASLNNAADDLAFNPNLGAVIDPNSVDMSRNGYGMPMQENSNQEVVSMLANIIDLLYALLDKDSNVYMDGKLVTDIIKQYMSQALNEMKNQTGINQGFIPRPT